MPMTQADVRDCIAPELKEFGMRRRGFRWFWSGPEVRWTLHLAKIPRREWVSFELSGGLAAEDPGTPSSPTGRGFQLHMYLADWDIDENVTVRMVEDLGYTALPDNTRRALLKRMAAMVCRYVIEHSTVEQLVRAYAAGEYRSSIIFQGPQTDAGRLLWMRLTLPRCDTDNHSVALRMRRLAVMARSSRLRGCWVVVLGAVGLAGRSSRRQGQLAGAVPPPRPVDRPAWRDGVSHVVTPPPRDPSATPLHSPLRPFFSYSGG